MFFKSARGISQGQVGLGGLHFPFYSWHSCFQALGRCLAQLMLEKYTLNEWIDESISILGTEFFLKEAN